MNEMVIYNIIAAASSNLLFAITVVLNWNMRCKFLKYKYGCI
jgi:hypothetical protein